MAGDRKVIDMLTVRFHRTFRERYPEFILAIVDMLWGWNAWRDALDDNVMRHTFYGGFYEPLLHYMDQLHWGIFGVTVGFVRTLCLIINGTRPRGSASMRAIGAWASSLLWMALFFGACVVPWNDGGVYSYGALLAFDIFALCFAAKDARLAFDRAREAKRYGLA